jgi:hypothetical protein
MSVVSEYRTSGTAGMWATVVLEDGLVFEGVVQNELSQGVYLAIGGDPSRLSMFPWGRVTRVSYKLTD